MGELYRARDTRLDRTVAIKILPERLSKDPIRKQRFEREAKTISSLNHPNICTLHDIGSQDGVDYLVMECVEALILRGPSGEPLNLDNLSKRIMMPLLKAAGLTWHGWYTLRRGVATTLAGLDA